MWRGRGCGTRPSADGLDGERECGGGRPSRWGRSTRFPAGAVGEELACARGAGSPSTLLEASGHDEGGDQRPSADALLAPDLVIAALATYCRPQAQKRLERSPWQQSIGMRERVGVARSPMRVQIPLGRSWGVAGLISDPRVFVRSRHPPGPHRPRWFHRHVLYFSLRSAPQLLTASLVTLSRKCARDGSVFWRSKDTALASSGLRPDFDQGHPDDDREGRGNCVTHAQNCARIIISRRGRIAIVRPGRPAVLIGSRCEAVDSVVQETDWRKMEGQEEGGRGPCIRETASRIAPIIHGACKAASPSAPREEGEARLRGPSPGPAWEELGISQISPIPEGGPCRTGTCRHSGKASPRPLTIPLPRCRRTFTLARTVARGSVPSIPDRSPSPTIPAGMPQARNLDLRISQQGLEMVPEPCLTLLTRSGWRKLPARTMDDRRGIATRFSNTWPTPSLFWPSIFLQSVPDHAVNASHLEPNQTAGRLAVL